VTWPGSRSDEERERARLEREARRAGRADPPTGTQPPDPDPPTRVEPPPARPHLRDRVEAALARSRARRSEAPPRTPKPDGGMTNGDQPRAARVRRRARGPLALALVIAAAVVVWFLVSLYQPGKGDGGAAVTLKIPRGAGLGVVAERLDNAGVIGSRFFFKLRARLAGHTSDLKPGVYRLRKDMAYSAVLTKLTKGVRAQVIEVTIPEGRAISEVAPLLRRSGVKGDYTRATRRSRLLSPRHYGAPHGATLEGFLFPATYQLRHGATVRTLVAKQLQAFKQNIAKVGMRYARKKNLTVFDVVTIASMVEREASLPRERPLIASVIYNRLHDHMQLGIDATLRYALRDWNRPLRVSQLNSPSPYNTRKYPGLPPGPIGNPGLASLRAAAHPAHTKYLYYVVKPCGDGEQVFSSSYAQFQRDVAKYNVARAKKGGRSPAKC
jgi:UPF0755 protein